MIETNEFIYKLEDLVTLGKSLPLIAFKQLQQIMPKFAPYQEVGDIGMMEVKCVMQDFFKEGMPDFEGKDERALIRLFKRHKKKYPDLLLFYRENSKTFEQLRKHTRSQFWLDTLHDPRNSWGNICYEHELKRLGLENHPDAQELPFPIPSEEEQRKDAEKLESK